MASPSGQFRPWRLIWTFVGIVVVLYGLVFFTPGSNTPKLGIDLQGGTRITLTARTIDGSDPTREQMQQARTIMEGRVNGSGVVGAQVQIDGARQLVVTVPGNEDLSGLTRSAQLNIRPVLTDTSGNPIIVYPAGYTPPTATTSTAPSVTGSQTPSGSSAPSTVPAIGDTAEASPAPSATPSSAPSAESGAATTVPAIGDTPAATSPAGLRGAGAALGAAPEAAAATDSPSAESAATETPSATPAATDSPAPTAAATAPATPAAGPTWPTGSNPDNPTQPLGTDQAAFDAWQTSAQTVMPTISCADLEPYRGLDDPNKPLLACSDTGDSLYLLDKTLIAGTQIDTASSGQSSQGAGWVVNMTFKSDGYSTWSSYTASHTGTLTAMTLDGQVISAPRISGPITTPGTEISGSFNQASAAALANSLKFGALPLAFDRAESVNVSAELGYQYLIAGIIAGGIGLLLVVVYCLIYYRMLGLITILSLILSFGLVYPVLVLLGRWVGYSLDMAGVAGLIIAIGITADSFVIYFERIKDEVREGRTFRSAVPRGWARAKRTILSADAVSFLSAFILYILAVGEVKGFAFTLGLSTVLDLVVVFLVTHPLVHLAAGSKLFQSPTWSGLGGVAKAGAQQRAAAAKLGAKEMSA
ncbi:protein translocase subunit SecD [Nakamurella sp.]|uniref:protein translocase subunit SecD n=1 Tax=Nakamurella sp. TaxID=1869182 RepID=UPI003B3A71B8